MTHLRHLQDTLNAVDTGRIEQWGRHLAGVLARGGRLLACGNGGSAAEAQHLTAELVGRFDEERPSLSAIALHADTSSMTGICNDYGAAEMYARQVRGHGRVGDVLICLSTSGHSPNVVNAAETARSVGLTAWSMTGAAPNALTAACHDAVAVPTERVATVQEVHLALIHALCAVVDASLPAPKSAAEPRPRPAPEADVLSAYPGSSVPYVPVPGGEAYRDRGPADPRRDVRR